MGDTREQSDKLRALFFSTLVVVSMVAGFVPISESVQAAGNVASDDLNIDSNDWHQFQNDSRNSGHNPSVSAPVSSASELWNFSAGSRVDSSPVIVNDTVYVTVGGFSPPADVYALNATDGSERWDFSTESSTNGSPAVAYNTLYYGAGNTTYALNVTDGSERWSFSFSSFEDPQTPTVSNNTVYVGTKKFGDANLTALNATDGSERWNFTISEGDVNGSPAVVSDTVYFATGGFNNTVFALNATDGSERWNFSVDNTFTGISVVNNTVYAGNFDNNVYALDAADGSERWNFTAGDGVNISPAVVNDTVYIGTETGFGNDANVTAVNATDGSERWNFTTGHDVKSSPIVVNNTVYVGSNDNNMYALDATDGSERWNFTAGDWVTSSPTAKNGILYFGGVDNNVYALNESGSGGGSDGEEQQDTEDEFGGEEDFDGGLVSEPFKVIQAGTSITPSSVDGGNVTDFTLNIKLNHTKLNDTDSGELEVRLEGFNETGKRTTIDYTSNDVTNGNLTVSTTISNARAPPVPGRIDVPVLVTALRRDSSDDLLQDVRIPATFVTVNSSLGLSQVNITITNSSSTFQAGDTIQFNVTNQSGAPKNATVLHPGIEPDTAKLTGDDGLVNYTVNITGQLEALALPPAALADEPSESGGLFAPGTVEFTVEGASLGVNRSSINFGTVPVGQSTTSGLNITNSADRSIPLRSLFVTGFGSGAFEVEESEGKIPANTNRTVNVTFSPFRSGNANGTLFVNSKRVSLSGTGTAPQISANKTFVEITSNGGTTNTTIKVTNGGNSDLNASITVRRGENTGLFSQPDWVNVSAGSSETFDVEFDPGSSNFGFQDLRLVPQSGAGELRVAVAGILESSEVRLGQSEIDFGTVPTKDPRSRLVRVENTGTTTETFNAATNDTANFTLSGRDRGAFTLFPGEANLLRVEANLSTEGEAVANLTVAKDEDDTLFDNSPKDTLVLRASAQAPNISIANAEPVNFGDTAQDSTAIREIEIENDGNARLVAQLDQAFTLSEQATFSIIGNRRVSVPAGQSRNVTIGATPDTTGTITGDLTLTGINDPDVSERNVQLEVNGTTSQLSAETSGTVEFGEIGVQGTATRTVTVSTPIGSILADSVTATGPFEVTSITDSVPIISDGTDITVQFDPSTNGTGTGALEIDSNGDGEANFTKALSGSARYGELRVDQPVIGTGVARANQGTTTGTVTIRNPVGNTTLTVDDITVQGSQFSRNASSEIGPGDDIAGDGQGTLAIDFDPTTTGEQRGTVTIDATSGERTFNRTLAVFGFGTGPEPVLADDTLSVGTVEVGESVRETVTVRNEGGGPFTVESVDDSSSAIQSATVLGNGRTFPGGETDIELVVNPSSTGTIDEDIDITTSAGTDPTLTVTGKATAPELNTDQLSDLSFGDTPLGSASQQEIELNNTGDAPLVIAQPTITGANSGDFEILSGDRTLRIGAQSSQNISIGFGPDDTGSRDATLEIDPVNDDGTSLQEIGLGGNGTAANARLNRSTVGFGDVPLGTTETETLEITNTGTAGIQVTGSSITGSDSGAFSVVGTVSTILASGESTTITVQINTTGTTRGGLSSQLELTTNTSSTVTSSLGGTGVSSAIETTSQIGTGDFGTTRLGETSTATFQVNNTGNADLNLTDLSITGENASAFSITRPTNASRNTTIAGQSSSKITLQFDPLAASNPVSNAQGSLFTADANLTINNSDPDSSDQSLNVDLSGEAETAALNVPSTYQYGQTPQGQTTTAQVGIENQPAATAPLNVTDISVDGPDSGDFAVELNGSKTTPHTLTAGDTVDLNISITPTSDGLKFATVTVETNDSRQPAAKIGVSNREPTGTVDYGSVNVTYINPIADDTEPTVNVDRGFLGRNATLANVNSNVSTTADYSLNYTYNSTAETTLNESDSVNASALQYVNATTTAADENFTESTFQMELSKAALGDEDPENATIYHDKGDNGEYRTLNTTLLYETEQGYVYEATTDSYSVFAIGVDESDDGVDDNDDTDDTDDTADTDDTEASSGGGGGAPISGSTVSTVQTTDGVTATVEQVTGTDPTVSVDTTGVQTDLVSVEEVSTTFEGVSNANTQISITATTSKPSGTPDPPTSGGSVLSYVEINVEGALAGSTSQGTFTLDVSNSDLSAEAVTVQRYDGETWESVKTGAVDASTVRVFSPDGYSVFAVSTSEETVPESETPAETGTGAGTEDSDTPTGPSETESSSVSTATPSAGETPTATPSVTATPAETPGAFGPGFGLFGVILALLAVTLWVARRRP